MLRFSCRLPTEFFYFGLMLTNGKGKCSVVLMFPYFHLFAFICLHLRKIRGSGIAYIETKCKI